MNSLNYNNQKIYVFPGWNLETEDIEIASSIKATVKKAFFYKLNNKAIEETGYNEESIRNYKIGLALKLESNDGFKTMIPLGGLEIISDILKKPDFNPTSLKGKQTTEYWIGPNMVGISFEK